MLVAQWHKCRHELPRVHIHIQPHSAYKCELRSSCILAWHLRNERLSPRIVCRVVRLPSWLPRYCSCGMQILMLICWLRCMQRLIIAQANIYSYNTKIHKSSCLLTIALIYDDNEGCGEVSASAIPSAWNRCAALAKIWVYDPCDAIHCALYATLFTSWETASGQICQTGGVVWNRQCDDDYHNVLYVYEGLHIYRFSITQFNHIHIVGYTIAGWPRNAFAPVYAWW